MNKHLVRFFAGLFGLAVFGVLIFGIFTTFVGVLDLLLQATHHSGKFSSFDRFCEFLAPFEVVGFIYVIGKDITK